MRIRIMEEYDYFEICLHYFPSYTVNIGRNHQGQHLWFNKLYLIEYYQ